MTVGEAMQLIRSGPASSRFRKGEHPAEPRELLIDSRIWFSAMDSLDDIYEGEPLYEWDTRIPSVAQLAAMAARQDPSLSTADRAEFAAMTQRRMLDPVDGEIMRQWMEIEGDRMYAASSVCCFFRNPCVQRCWAEYADRGRGFVVVFDFPKPWNMVAGAGDKPIRMKPMPVEYLAGFERPRVPMSLAHDVLQPSFEPIRKGLLTKPDQWESQEEHRIVRLQIGEGHIDFPPESLAALILGYDITDDNAGMLLDLNSRRPKPVPVFKARPALRTNGFDLHPVATVYGSDRS